MFRWETITKNPKIWTDKQWWIYNVRCGIKRYRLSDKKLNGDQMECSQRKQKSAMDLHNEMNWRMISGNVQWNESKINCIASERQARPIVDSAKTALSESDSRQEKKYIGCT